MKSVMKCILFILYITFIFWIEKWEILGSLFLIHFFGIVIRMESIKKLMHNLKIILPFILLTASFNVIVGDWMEGILMAERLLLAYQIMYLFSKSMTTTELVEAIEKVMSPLGFFKMNIETIGVMVNIAFCIIPILKVEMEQKKYALQAKGSKLKLNNFFPVIGMMFITILRKTNEMEKTLKSKAYEE